MFLKMDNLNIDKIYKSLINFWKGIVNEMFSESKYKYIYEINLHVRHYYGTTIDIKYNYKLDNYF
uniref:Uncharacterized protein n=1 Tax=Pithovirus LCDPAC02 TaxID=2506601 RepID=A0A481YNU2_9VIRU|nr:MAG: hypothetical protein LCDPAC02_01370 [Pithovirus LCDPAC02]